MWTAIITFLVKGIFMGLGEYMKGEEQDSDFYRSYMSFLQQANKKGLVKVANLKAGEDALARLEKRTEDRSNEPEK